MVDLNKLFEVAKKIALEVGKYQVKMSKEKYKIEMKEKAIYNNVTEIDIESEKRIVSYIKDNFPEHDIVGEEGKYPNTNNDYKWIIDPIDGTNNFIKGIPLWSVSIACTYKDETVMGIVYNPSLDDLYYAKKNQGAYKNDQKIEVSKNIKLEGSLFATGFYYDRSESMQKNLKVISKVLESNVMGIRRLGSASIDMCFCAEGSLDGFWEHHLSVWDFAAAILIVREAGGVVLDFSGQEKKLENGSLIAIKEVTKDKLLKIIKQSF